MAEGAGQVGGRADEGSERIGGQADERTGVGTLGGQADGGGQWADRRTGAGRARTGGRADGLVDKQTGADSGGRISEG